MNRENMNPENFDEHSCTYRQTLLLESDPSEVEGVEGLVQQKLSDIGWTEDEIGDFCLAVREAVLNAIIHGNRAMLLRKYATKRRCSPAEDGVTAERWAFIPRPKGPGLSVRLRKHSALKRQFPPDNILLITIFGNKKGRKELAEYCAEKKVLDGWEKQNKELIVPQETR